MGFGDNLRKLVMDWLKISPPMTNGVDITATLDHPTEVFINKIWMRGDANELTQLYKQINLGQQTFWFSESSRGQDMRKIHTGIPRLIVNTLTNISIDDLSDFVFDNPNYSEIWKDIEDENQFERMLKAATKNVLALDDGAFKIGYDATLSNLPIIQFYESDDVEFRYDRGRIKEVIFFTRYKADKKRYTLKETYGYGYIKYKLVDDYDKEVDMSTLPETTNLQDVEFDKSIMFAIPYIIYESDKFEGRGASIFTGKYDAFDALDETYSQWIDALRSGKTKTYIPECLLPRDENTGMIRQYNPFDTRYIAIGTDVAEGARNQITTTGGNFQVDTYIQTYCTSLDLCLQGIISPSTLGIDVKKLDNGEAQREKEKTTLYTRNAIISAATNVINQLIQKSFNMLQLQNGMKLEDVEVHFSFGEYANPSFESVVETMSNPNTPMSIEAKVEEVWGDSKDEEWKAEEVARIKAERGIVVLDEPSLV